MSIVQLLIAGSAGIFLLLIIVWVAIGKQARSEALGDLTADLTKRLLPVGVLFLLCGGVIYTFAKIKGTKFLPILVATAIFAGMWITGTPTPRESRSRTKGFLAKLAISAILFWFIKVLI